MKDDNVISFKMPEGNFHDHLTEILRQGCRGILQEALEVEVETFIEHYKHLKDEQGRQRIIRNGYLPEREIQTGVGQVAARVPRSRDRDTEGKPIRFRSALLLPHLRRTRSIEELLPWL
jgi:transposase-like protein